MNSANIILRVCADQVGLTLDHLGKVTADAGVSISGATSPGDSVGLFVLAPGAERFGLELDDRTIRRESGAIRAPDSGSRDHGSDGPAAELGVLILTDSDFGVGNRGGATEATVALIARYGVPEVVPEEADDDDEGDDD